MQRGFTLVELLVVIAIIALLATILIPSVRFAQELARRAKCESNAKGIAEACVAYMNDGKMHRNSNDGNGMPRSRIAPTTSNWSSGGSGNPASLWVLVNYKLVPRDTFLCPSAEVHMDYRSPPANANRFTRDTLSYSYLSQVIFTDQSPEAVRIGMTNIKLTSNLHPELKASELAIVADSSPRSRVDTQSLDSLLEGGYRNQNSFNHNGAGQNVGFMDGHAAWYSSPEIPGTRPLSNSNEPDNIYEPCGGGNAASGQRGSINDAYLIP